MSERSGRTEPLNLARRPFVNGRPVVRLALLLWVLGAVLLASNVASFWSYYSGSAEKRGQLAKVREERDRERQQIASLERSLSGFDLERQNRQVAFLNRKIADRTFSWSRLLDRLAEVMPDEVRLDRLAPQGVVDRRAGTRGARDKQRPSDKITLVISGEAKSGEALLRFVDNLFAHPSFEDPDLSQESRAGGLVEFNLQVTYLPKGRGPVVEEAEDAGKAAGAAPARATAGAEAR